MKHKLLLGITLSLFAASGAFAQTPAPTNKETAEPTALVFVPKKLLQENKIAGKLKENTFYWTSELADPKDGPKGVAEDGKQFLRIKGCGTDTTPEDNTILRVTRVYNVPANTKSATVHLTVRQKYDEWNDINPKTKRSAVLYTLRKDGLEIRNGSTIANNEAETKGAIKFNGQWQTTHYNINIAKGTQQLVINAYAEFSTSLDVESLSVTFTPTDAPKAP